MNTTFENSRLSFVLKLAEYFSLENRFPGSEHHENTRVFIKNFLKKLGNYNSQQFEFELFQPLWSKVYMDLASFKGLPYANSKKGNIEAPLIDCGFGTPTELLKCDVKGKIVLLREGKHPFSLKEKLLYQKGAKGILIYREEVDDYFAGLSVGLLPVVSIKRSDLVYLPSVVKIQSDLKKVKVKGENIWIDFGALDKPHILTLIAHYDTKHYTKGAVDNALSVALLLLLASELANDKKLRPYRIRLLFTDAEEFGLKGAEYFVQNLPLKELASSYVISVDTVGWHNPAILVGDSEGKASNYLANMVEKLLNFLRIRQFFTFSYGRSGRSDHIPFRKRGAKTLFFASHPFPYRHTSLDTPSIIVPKVVQMWITLLRFLVKNFHKVGKLN